MLHTILFGFLAAFLVSRILLRRRFMRYAFGGGCGRGGWGHMHRHWHGGGGRWGGWRGGPAFFYGGRPYFPGGPGGPGGPGRWDEGDDDDAPSIDLGSPGRFERALGELELSERQRLEVDESLARLRESLGGRDLGTWRGIVAALHVVAAADFDRARAEAATGHVSGTLRKEIVDGLEHFHNVLTAEQREKLSLLTRA